VSYSPTTVLPFEEPGSGSPSARRFEGRRALVTGGGGGIGRAVALRLAAEGAYVFVADLDRAKAQATVDAAGPASARALTLDVRDEGSVRALVDEVGEGGLDLLVNNAGIEILGGIEEISPDVWDDVMAVNLRGPYLVSRTLLPALRQGAAAHGEAAIVHNASLMGQVSSPGLAAYCASKAGLISLTRSMALDLAASHIRVNCVCPGIIHTSMLERRFALTPDRDEAYAATSARPPLQYIGRPEDVAAAIAYLAAPESRFVTGSALVIDGGVGAA